MNHSSSIWIAWLVAIAIAAPAMAEDDELDELRKMGRPVSVADLKPEAVGDQDNAFKYLMRAKQSVIQIDTELNESYQWGQPASKEFIDQFEQAVARHPDVYQLLLQAAEQDCYVPDLDFDQGPQQFIEASMAQNSLLRSVARVLQYRASVQLAKGEPDSAAQTSLAILKLGRHAFGNYGMANYLVSIAVTGMGLHQLKQVLQTSELRLEKHQQIAEVLATHQTLERFQQALISERAIGIDMLKHQRIARVHLYLKTMDTLIANSIKQKFQQPMLVDRQPRDPMIGMILPAVSQSRLASMRILAQTRALQIINALNYQIAEEPFLEHLDLPNDAKVDPFSGNAMLIKRVDNGWIVYSVASNQQDDGGSFDRMLDFGFGPSQ